MQPTRIFVSSVQKELAAERRAVRDFVQADALLRRFFSVFLFEDLPAGDQRADEVYLNEVDRCDVYVGLFGNDYGFEDAAGVSPTEHEFDRATAQGKPRLVYLKGAHDKARHAKMAALVRKAGDQRADEVYLGEVDRCDVYVGLFGNDYGFEDAASVSPPSMSSTAPRRRASRAWCT